MYRTKEDFLADWEIAAQGTKRVLEALTDDKLDQSIVEGHSTLGWLGWHLATSPAFFGGQVGLNVTPAGGKDDVPTKANQIVEAYNQIAEDVKKQVAQSLSDEHMVETVDSFGRQTPRGALLRMMIDHQTHHRGQMTVLLRQAGLTVPGVMGPTKEEQM
ncbi:damage-inducible protein DinB [Ornithinibacillus sp. L9]|uniref:Damage-inducible protein DinB n=1 Tax=Ornithinibacillus caprae TaxID=2678566 RepID=A0A6N8FE81_9BACI|nr:DinB family protein [Ornithinibacillus caprae]MUK87982.1 damage-inducible protein DinB [Ornithinibacillus caprae]